MSVAELRRIEIAQAVESSDARRALEVMHAVAHEIDATLDRRALPGIEPVGHADDPLHVLHQVALGGQGALGQPRGDLPRKGCRVLPARHDGGKPSEVNVGVVG